MIIHGVTNDAGVSVSLIAVPTCVCHIRHCFGS